MHGAIEATMTQTAEITSGGSKAGISCRNKSVNLDDLSLNGCTLQRQQEPEVISVPRFDRKQIQHPETDEIAMTVQANDIWCPTATRPITSSTSAKDTSGSDGDRKSRVTDRKPTVSDPERGSDGADSSTRPAAGRKGVRGRGLRVIGGRTGRRTHGSAGAVEFLSSGGSEPETDVDSEGVSFLSAPETLPPQKPCRDTRNKMRFKKFFRPLRRSKSIGNTKESSSSTSSTSSSSTSSTSSSSPSSSAFSFLHRKENDCTDGSTCSRQSVDTGRGSMDLLSDREIEEDEDNEEEKTKGANSIKDQRKKRSITTEVKEKIDLLLRRYSDLTGSQKEGKLERPNAPESIKNWSKTIDHLLADKFGLQCFHAFLKSEFSEENVDFWMSVESYKALKPSRQPAQAQRIYAEYIAHQAPKEINIDSVTRDLTSSRMTQPDSTTFDPAQKRIQALMDKDSYPRFIQSTLYQELVAGSSPLLTS